MASSKTATPGQRKLRLTERFREHEAAPTYEEIRAIERAADAMRSAMG